MFFFPSFLFFNYCCVVFLLSFFSFLDSFFSCFFLFFFLCSFFLSFFPFLKSCFFSLFQYLIFPFFLSFLFSFFRSHFFPCLFFLSGKVYSRVLTIDAWRQEEYLYSMDELKKVGDGKELIQTWQIHSLILAQNSPEIWPIFARVRRGNLGAISLYERLQMGPKSDREFWGRVQNPLLGLYNTSSRVSIMWYRLTGFGSQLLETIKDCHHIFISTVR